MIDLYLLCTDLKNNKSTLNKKSLSIIREIYYLLENSSDKTKTIYEGWDRNFKYIYGDINANLSSNNKLKTDHLLEKYSIDLENNSSIQVKFLFFSIQTYFCTLIKIMMKNILFNDEYFSNIDLILGNYAIKYGIKNYNHPDWYSWPIFELDNGFNKVIEEITESLSKYRTNVDVKEFAQNNNYDYIKQMYEAVIPKELRHALGEYYTPDWLAEETLNTVLSFDKAVLSKKFIDPTCGSGTFLIKTIIEKRKKGATLKDILNSVCGIDINPLAVLTSKTNYLLAILDLLDNSSQIELPVFLADVINKEDCSEFKKTEKFFESQNPEIEICKYTTNDNYYLNLRPKADVLLGNPPWVNWEYLPEEYRNASQHLWVDYQLFDAKGRELSFSKEDISVLITYIVIDKFLKTNGLLGFVIRQGVFKSSQNGVGFRRFKLKDECGIKVLRVDDLSKIKAFDNATNSTALIYLRKGKNTEYPVDYFYWKKREDLEKFSFNSYSSMREIKAQVNIVQLKARPAVEEDVSSIWVTSDENSLKKMKTVLGSNTYKARTGVFSGGANAVYWLKILKKNKDSLEVTNIVERAKRKTAKVLRKLECDYVYPMLKGSNVKMWQYSYDTYLLCPHSKETKMWPIPQEVLKEKAPNTYNYLFEFKKDLDCRKGFAGWEREIQNKEFHAILRIGDYTFSKYKVIWRYIASEFICAVISYVDDAYLGKKMLIPNEKIMYVSFDDELEAYYLCGVLSSTLVSNCVKSFMNPTSISAHVLNKLKIQSFDLNNQDHINIAKLCKEGHEKKNTDFYISKIDLIVKKIYGLD